MKQRPASLGTRSGTSDTGVNDRGPRHEGPLRAQTRWLEFQKGAGVLAKISAKEQPQTIAIRSRSACAKLAAR